MTLPYPLSRHHCVYLYPYVYRISGSMFRVYFIPCWYTDYPCGFTRDAIASVDINCHHVCLSVRPSVRLSQVGVLLKRLNVGSHKQRNALGTPGTLVS